MAVCGCRFTDDNRDDNFSNRSDTYGNSVTRAGERDGEKAWQGKNKTRKMETTTSPTFLV
jgi:hypothetical protein